MGKDRLAELQAASKFVKESDVAKQSDSEEMKPLKKQDKNMSASQEDFFRSLQSVVSSIEQVEANVVEVKKLQKKILNSVRADSQDQAKLNDLNDANKKLAKDIRSSLKMEQDKIEKALSTKTLSPKVGKK